MSNWFNCCNPRNFDIANCQTQLNNCPNYKVYPRIYLQYNELVFNGIESVDTIDLSGDFKIETTPYPFRHGSYYGGSFKEGRQLMKEQDLSLDLNLPFINLTRLQVLDYHNYIMYNLTRAGKIWAVDAGGKLIWANAIPKHPPYSDYEVKNGRYVRFSMDFLLPDGIWHVADTTHVYLEPYDLCDFKDSFGTGCSHDCNSMQQCKDEECFICSCVTEDMNYCNTCWNPYDNCENPYKIIYNCAIGHDFYGNKMYGQEYIGDCDCLAGSFCTNSIFDADVTVTLIGKFENPKVEMNDVRIGVNGIYDGRLVFNPDGSIEYYKGEPCDTGHHLPEMISYDDIEYYDNRISFSAKHGDNYFNVIFGEKSSITKLAYIKVDEITS